ncbi:MAG: imidazoleglycerol-phosphate dehydratase HisB [Anaerolineaceae bacterium]|nr:imidazoleglycerol-phosphate dehydratase HisB [Anaerolineaceae bacterium]
MKIGIIYSPSASIMDIAGLIQTFTLAKQLFSDLNIQFEICSFLPQKTQETGITINASFVGLPLSGFDILVLPGSAGYEKLMTDIHWLTWVQGSGSVSTFYGFHEGISIINLINQPNQWKSNTRNPLNGFFVALQVLTDILEVENIRTIAKTLGIETSWQTYLQTMNIRQSALSRDTAETQIRVNLALDGSGKSNIITRIPFLDHMLSQIAKHGLFDIELVANGDLEIDQHHTMEDCGIILGDAFRLALGDKKGINRMASTSVPMDESLATVTIDFSGRPYFVIQSKWNGENITEIPVSLFEHFLESFAIAARCNLYIQVQAGKDNHHMCEAIFKALARALDQACSLDMRRLDQIPSTKEKIF